MVEVLEEVLLEVAMQMAGRGLDFRSLAYPRREVSRVAARMKAKTFRDESGGLVSNHDRLLMAAPLVGAARDLADFDSLDRQFGFESASTEANVLDELAEMLEELEDLLIRRRDFRGIFLGPSLDSIRSRARSLARLGVDTLNVEFSADTATREEAYESIRQRAPRLARP